MRCHCCLRSKKIRAEQGDSPWAPVTRYPVKGRGGTGVGFHPFVNGEVALLSAAVSAAGFVRGKRAVRAEKRAKASVKGSGVDVTPAT